MIRTVQRHCCKIYKPRIFPSLLSCTLNTIQFPLSAILMTSPPSTGVAAKATLHFFDSSIENLDISDIDGVEDWHERFDQYCLTNPLIDTSNKTAHYITKIGKAGYRLLKDLAYPDSVSSKDVTDLQKLLLEHLRPTNFQAAERERFHNLAFLCVCSSSKCSNKQPNAILVPAFLNKCAAGWWLELLIKRSSANSSRKLPLLFKRPKTSSSIGTISTTFFTSPLQRSSSINALRQSRAASIQSRTVEARVTISSIDQLTNRVRRKKPDKRDLRSQSPQDPASRVEASTLETSASFAQQNAVPAISADTSSAFVVRPSQSAPSILIPKRRPVSSMFGNRQTTCITLWFFKTARKKNSSWSL